MASPRAQLRKAFEAEIKAMLVPGSAAAGAPLEMRRMVGCIYVLNDYDGDPLYVGKSKGLDERLGARLRRHVTGQRSDAAGKVFPPVEVHSVDVYPMRVPAWSQTPLTAAEKALIDAAEGQVYATLVAAGTSPLNEKAPKAPAVAVVAPASAFNVPFTTNATLIGLLYSDDTRAERWAELIRNLSETIDHGGANVRLRAVRRLQVDRLKALI